jgi:hypothetical protein
MVFVCSSEKSYGIPELLYFAIEQTGDQHLTNAIPIVA